jgi:hypothetical protein
MPLPAVPAACRTRCRSFYPRAPAVSVELRGQMLTGRCCPRLGDHGSSTTSTEYPATRRQAASRTSRRRRQVRPPDVSVNAVRVAIQTVLEVCILALFLKAIRISITLRAHARVLFLVSAGLSHESQEPFDPFHREGMPPKKDKPPPVIHPVIEYARHIVAGPAGTRLALDVLEEEFGPTVKVRSPLRASRWFCSPSVTAGRCIVVSHPRAHRRGLTPAVLLQLTAEGLLALGAPTLDELRSYLVLKSVASPSTGFVGKDPERVRGATECRSGVEGAAQPPRIAPSPAIPPAVARSSARRCWCCCRRSSSSSPRRTR